MNRSLKLLDFTNGYATGIKYVRSCSLLFEFEKFPAVGRIHWNTLKISEVVLVDALKRRLQRYMTVCYIDYSISDRWSFNKLEFKSNLFMTNTYYELHGAKLIYGRKSDKVLETIGI